MRFFASTTLLALAACSDAKQPITCASGFVGDPAQAPKIAMVYTDGFSEQLWGVSSGLRIPLEPPPQGGYVMYVAARALNMDACVRLSGTLRDAETGDQVGFDTRRSTLIPGAAGWGWPDPRSNSNLSNVNGCPDYSTKDIQGRLYTLEMEVTDQDGRTAQVSMPIVPFCSFADPVVQADCMCTCSANFVLGKCSR